MKYSSKISYYLLLLFLVAGCSLFRSQPTGTLFTFEHEDKMYEIAGYVNESGESANYLTYREGDNVVFRAIDRNRTGVIDQVLSGSISMLEANEIYQSGIEMAMKQDLFKNIERNRTFELQYGDYQLMIESYQKTEEEFHNRFVLYDLNWNLKGIYWDDDSNGTIDRREAGELELDLARELYSITIERAGEQNRLEKTGDDQVIISLNTKPQNEINGVSD